MKDKGTFILKESTFLEFTGIGRNTNRGFLATKLAQKAAVKRANEGALWTLVPLYHRA